MLNSLYTVNTTKEILFYKQNYINQINKKELITNIQAEIVSKVYQILTESAAISIEEILKQIKQSIFIIDIIQERANNQEDVYFNTDEFDGIEKHSKIQQNLIAKFFLEESKEKIKILAFHKNNYYGIVDKLYKIIGNIRYTKSTIELKEFLENFNLEDHLFGQRYNRLSGNNFHENSNRNDILILNFCGYKLDRIPTEIFNLFPNLREIDLSNNQIVIPKNDKVIKLENSVVNLPNNRLRIFINTSITLKNLQKLDLSNNKITIIRSDTFVTLKNLQILNLANNLITTIAANAFTSLNNLHTLNLYNNKLIVSGIDMLTNLQKIMEDVNNTYIIAEESLQDPITNLITKSSILLFLLLQHIDRTYDILVPNYVCSDSQRNIFKKQKVKFKIIPYLIDESIKKEALLILGSKCKINKLTPNFTSFNDIKFLYDNDNN